MDLPVTVSEVTSPQISLCGVVPPLMIIQGFCRVSSLTHTSLKDTVRNFGRLGSSMQHEIQGIMELFSSFFAFSTSLFLFFFNRNVTLY